MRRRRRAGFTGVCMKRHWRTNASLARHLTTVVAELFLQLCLGSQSTFCGEPDEHLHAPDCGIRSRAYLSTVDGDAGGAKLRPDSLTHGCVALYRFAGRLLVDRERDSIAPAVGGLFRRPA